MPRRGENIWKRKDGRWEARYIKYRTPNNKPVYGYVYARAYKDVKKKRELITSKIQETVCKFDNITANAIFDKFLIHKKLSVKESTYVHYSDIINTHIRPIWGVYNISDIDSSVIDAFITLKLSKGRIDGRGGLSKKSVGDMISLIKQILKYAYESGYINELPKISSPKIDKQEIAVLTDDEQRALEDATKKSIDSYRFGIYMCLYTGLRIGEICALRWSDIDLNCSIIFVRRTIMRVKNIDSEAESKTKILIDTPKTDSSERKIPIPNFISDILSSMRRKASSVDSYVLTGNEKYIEPRNYYMKYKLCLKECGIGEYTFHTLRHTFATRAVECGFDVKALSEILGHSDVKITLERYVHPSMDLKRSYMNKMIDKL